MMYLGCGSDTPEVARFIRSAPADGQEVHPGDVIPYTLPIELYFDHPPIFVAVNGEPAEVVGDTAKWEYQSSLFRKADFSVTWQNQDGSDGDGTTITLCIIGCCPAFLAWGDVTNGQTDAEAQLLNQDGIRIGFDEAVIGTIDIRPLDGAPLGWSAEWSGTSVIIRPSNGRELVAGMTYIIEAVVTSVAKIDTEIRIQFTTKADQVLE